MNIGINEEITIKGVSFRRIKHDHNGNPRYIVGYAHLLTADEFKGIDYGEKFDIAMKRAKAFGMKYHRTYGFSGAFVFQSYNIEVQADYCAEIMAGDKKGVNE